LNTLLPIEIDVEFEEPDDLKAQRFRPEFITDITTEKISNGVNFKK
jgi:hypothetical protein